MDFDKTQNAYISLRNVIAERTESIVVWVGSGLSTPAGIPVWKTLREQLLGALRNKASSMDEESKHRILDVCSKINNQSNNWVAFEMLRNALGDATWKDGIREALRVEKTGQTPEIYSKIWKLHVHGMLNLNLDRLATKSFVETMIDQVPIEFVGKHASDYAHVLKSPQSFICNLHGDVQDASSWILTAKDLRLLLQNPGYRTFVQGCLTSKTIIFLGISADDLAVGSFLENLTKIGVDFGAHYWITSRRDLDTDKWAEKVGVRLIRYEAKDKDHSVLAEMFNDLESFISKDNPATALPIVPDIIENSGLALPTENELFKMESDEIRIILNKEAKEILQKGDPSAYENYEKFTQRYDEAIYRAWYTSTSSENNQLLGHTLQKEVASGAFGTVYQAVDGMGEQVAIKVLHEGIRKNSDLLHNFRRGVRSMRILKSHNITGMVNYRDAFEIPACVVMDWIDGPDLNKAVEAGQISDWATLLKVSSTIAYIVRQGHLLPERVLHRDLRPSNVMLKDYYGNHEDWQVIVLDFDLSWHRGAFERDVVHGSSALGYLAPEQLQEIRGVSTRHAAVDSFGLGMILYFLITGRNPIPEQHLHATWENDILKSAEKRPCDTWCSMPRCLARLIIKSTKHLQSERWDMAQIQGELERLTSAENEPESVKSAELLAEEFAYRSEFMNGYTWDDNQLAAIKDSALGARFELRGDESKRRIHAVISWGDPGIHSKKKLGKWIIPATESSADILQKGNWRIDDLVSKPTTAKISASVDVEHASETIDKMVECLQHSAEQLMQ